MLLRAIKLIKENALGDDMTLTPRFQMADRLVRLVFKYDINKDVKEVSKEFGSTQAILAAFVADLMRLSPHVALPQIDAAAAPSSVVPENFSPHIPPIAAVMAMSIVLDAKAVLPL